MSAISVRLSDELTVRLEKLAKRTGRTKSFYVVKAIEEHLQDLEDLYISEQRLIELRAGRSRTYTLDEAERELGLAD
jgi:RHH-type transcriptional regulator, rel operon repressor / antitoxin RelB